MTDRILTPEKLARADHDRRQLLRLVLPPSLSWLVLQPEQDPEPGSHNARFGNPSGGGRPVASNRRRAAPNREPTTPYGGLAMTTLVTRPAFMTELDDATAHTAAVMADPAATHQQKIQAAAAEEALMDRWMAATSDADAWLQREAEVEAG